MSHLIAMRQRIKAVETIKKITHAMRLIAMSSHSRMRHEQAPLNRYITELNTLFSSLQASTPTWQHPILHPGPGMPPKKLLIIIGSQKGLCGNFNSSLFSFVHHTLKTENLSQAYIILIGKKAVDYFASEAIGSVIRTYPEFTSRSIFSIAQDLSDYISQQENPYNKVQIVSNKVKSFFFQKPTLTPLIPFTPLSSGNLKENQAEGYAWEIDPHTILDTIAQQYLEAHLQHLLFESMLAEQAARFLSMDNSTRSANTLLEEMKLQYNKMRQAKITKELTELAGNF